MFGGANPIEPTCGTERGQHSKFGGSLSTILDDLQIIATKTFQGDS